MGRPRKNVILFLVEGYTDAITLERPIKAYAESLGEQFGATIEATILSTDHDVTSDKRNSPNNIQEKINRFYFEDYFSANEFYYPKDILEVVHIFDIDSVFVPEECCKEYDLLHNRLKGFIYDPPYIYGETKEEVIDRNQRKAEILRFLTAQDSIKVKSKKRPYYCCFFSINLDHCLHNELNIGGTRKTALAERFADEHETAEAFSKWLNESEQSLKGMSLQESWAFLEGDNGLNSTRRYTNLHIYFDGLRSRLQI